MNTNFHFVKRFSALFRPTLFLLLGAAPVAAWAQGTTAQQGGIQATAVAFFLFLIVSIALSKLWLGVLNVSFLHSEHLESIEKRQPHLPSTKTIVGTLIGTAILFALSLDHLRGLLPLTGVSSTAIISVAFLALGAGAVWLEQHWAPAREYIFAGMLGVSIALVLTAFHRALFVERIVNDPYLMALTVVTVVLSWRLLFGPWSPHVKATVLGAFIVCIAIAFLLNDPAQTRLARALSAVVAIVPAVIWCSLFLRFHRQRMSLVLLMFFAGMLSTAPVLFYDQLVRSNAELQFFFFRIVPENFNRTSNVFVSGNLVGITGVRSTLLITLLSFLLVGVVEEVSKYWVMSRSGKRFFTSIDDALQLSIIVAIGFAFAENVLNPAYFMSFVQEFLTQANPDWSAFLGNILGRAILTNMVHIVSTGVLGYFFGLALFAGPYLEEGHKRGRIFLLSDGLQSLLGLPGTAVFRRQVITLGIVAGVVLHGVFNFLVTFPDILPNNPQTLGDLFGWSGAFAGIPILIIPSMFYVVGGFWLLSELFERKENMKVRGHVVTTDTIITSTAVA